MELVHTYNYRGKVIKAYQATQQDMEDLKVDQNFLEWEENGLIYRIYVKSLEVNDQNYSLAVGYFWRMFVGGTEFENIVNQSKDPLWMKSIGEYVRFYYNQVTGNFGDFVRKGQLNTVSEAKNENNQQYFIGPQAFGFNPLNNYSPMQPITFDLATTTTGVTVTIVDTDPSYTLEYAIDSPSGPYQSLPAGEIPVNAGDHMIFIKDSTENYPFYQSFEIPTE